MGGTLPICPFCRHLCNSGGLKYHIKAKHIDEYTKWIINGCPAYWRYNDNGLLREEAEKNDQNTTRS